MKKKLPTLTILAMKLGLTDAQFIQKLNFLFPENRPYQKSFCLNKNCKEATYKVRCTGIGNIKNKHGDFIQYSFEVNDKWSEYSVLVKADSFDAMRMPIFTKPDYFLTRFDSHCETQMLFGDLTCDCMGQLELAIEKIAQRGEGAVIHIKRHEGRGKGIASKLDQLAICANFPSIDTVEASKLRAEIVEGIDTTSEQIDDTTIIDTRDFLGCVAILKFFNVPTKIKLMLQTNNPNKTLALIDNGYECIVDNVHTEPHEHNRHHLEAKRKNLNHDI